MMRVWLSLFLSILLVAFVLCFSYFYPRFLVQLMSEDSPWISYLYTYGTGALFFAIGSFWIFTRRAIHNMRRKEEIRWLITILCGMTFMFCFHGLWIFLAIHFPFKG